MNSNFNNRSNLDNFCYQPLIITVLIEKWVYKLFMGS